MMKSQRRDSESMMDYAIRTMDPIEKAEIDAAAKASADRIWAAVLVSREKDAESRRQAAAAKEG